MFAIIAGMVITIFYKNKTKSQSGITFTSKSILQYAVILLGFGMNLGSIAKTGAQSLPIILSTISISLIVSFVLYKALKIHPKIATLDGCVVHQYAAVLQSPPLLLLSAQTMRR